MATAAKFEPQDIANVLWALAQIEVRPAFSSSFLLSSLELSDTKVYERYMRARLGTAATVPQTPPLYKVVASGVKWRRVVRQVRGGKALEDALLARAVSLHTLSPKPETRNPKPETRNPKL